jgi:hypothetical protein
MDRNTRRFVRHAAELPVTLTFGDEKPIKASIRNLSIVGMFVSMEQPVQEGAACDVFFEVEPMKPVATQCVVVHVDSEGIGMEITGIENGSFEYLRELIVGQSGDPQACEDEILANMGNLPALY